ncbi:hypothetical protein FHR95_001235 [Halomonas fontilapidosi]|uniref:Uncharacterized protein n=1 Tax=Halomonas fontilapidosi TaxID=616675 RepID=A0A7W5GZ08_9GAMM|nr:hypothetical protein [Halomonas fontilapidosi]MBB3183681.1 hypothetical protein [Halomonas fontilapidosi]
MSLDDVFRAFAGTPDPATCPAPVPAQTRMVEPLGHIGHMGHNEKEGQQDKAGPAHEVETLLAALADAGRDIGPALAHCLRETLAPLSRQVRAELVAVIDDAFEVAPDIEDARRQAHRMLRNAKALEAAKVVWPAYPAPPAPTEAQAPAPSDIEPPWLAYVAHHCELVPDDRRYLLHHLAARPEAEATKLALQYVETWATAADAESQAQRRDNAGRRAANTMLRGATP